MSYDVEIRIFGEVSDPEAIFELANSAAAEGKINYLFDFKANKFPEMLEQAAREGQALTLTRRGATDLFDDIRTACQEARLSYVLKHGETGADDFTGGIAWNPELKKEREFLLSGNHLVFRGADVMMAAKRGIEAVNALVDNAMIHVRVGKIKLAPGFADAYEAFMSADEAPGLRP